MNTEISVSYETVGFQKGGTPLEELRPQEAPPASQPDETQLPASAWLGLGALAAFYMVMKGAIGS